MNEILTIAKNIQNTTDKTLAENKELKNNYEGF